MAERPAADRMRVLIALSLALAVFILLRFAFIMLGKDRSVNLGAARPAPAERGSIVGRRGQLIALQTRLWSVTAWKPDVVDPVETARRIADVLGGDPNRISRLLSGGGASRFVFIERQVTPTQSDRIRGMMDAGELPGIGLQEELGRHYPMKNLAAPLVGYVGTDNVGLDGIEYAFDRVLAPGGMSAPGTRVYGDTVHLTLDMNAQYIVERIAGETWEEHNPESLTALVMDARSGEFLSWVSLPSFDPNTFGSFESSRRINRPLVNTYEPGSVFKVFTWAAFLENGGVDVSDVFETSGRYEPELFQRYGIQPITDLANFGAIDLRGAIVNSSNVAPAMASESISEEAFYRALKNFGFGSPTGLPLPGESHGLLNAVEDWSDRSKPTIAFGHEIGVSAVQMITAATVLANGGVLLQPRIVDRVTAADGSLVKEYGRTPVREVISPKTARVLLEMMEQAVIDPRGTARRAAVPGLRISAKSGTAQVADPETGRYSEDRFFSSTLAVFPTDDPRLIVYVVLENPRGGSIFGAQTAAPMVREVARQLSPMFGIALEGNTVMEHTGSLRIENPVPEPLGDTLHDMRGYSKRMLLPYLAREDIRWTIDGEGWVVFQFPPPGTPLESGMSVFLELE